MLTFDDRAKDWDKNPTRIERAIAVAKAIRAAVPLSPEMTAFEYGCGTGLLSFALRPYLGPITLADVSTRMLDVLREKIAAAGVANMTPLRLDLASDRLPAERFDIIYTLMTLHHIPDTAKILGSFHALLNPGGYLCIADLDQEDGSFHSSDSTFDGHNGFARHDLRHQLLAAGFGEAKFSTCFEMVKDRRTYPLFLAVAHKG